jgi:hypothetical protein
MNLPLSGPLSLQQIQAEFGGTNPISLNEYYAGGAYVPVGAVSTTDGITYTPIPTSGAISISNFYGSTSVVSRGIVSAQQGSDGVTNSITIDVSSPQPILVHSSIFPGGGGRILTSSFGLL